MIFNQPQDDIDPDKIVAIDEDSRISQNKAASRSEYSNHTLS